MKGWKLRERKKKEGGREGERGRGERRGEGEKSKEGITYHDSVGIDEPPHSLDIDLSGNLVNGGVENLDAKVPGGLVEGGMGSHRHNAEVKLGGKMNKRIK